MNPTQRMPEFRSGQPLKADALNHIVQAVLRMIEAGKGINVRSAAGKIVVEAEGQPIPRTGGGGDVEFPTIWYTAASKAELPEGDGIAETALGRVTAGAQQGMVCIRNAANDGWEALNFLE